MREKDGTDTSELTVNGEHYFLSLPPSLSFCLSTQPQVPCETVGAILYTANRAVFLVPAPIASHKWTKMARVKRDCLEQV